MASDWKRDIRIAWKMIMVNVEMKVQVLINAFMKAWNDE